VAAAQKYGADTFVEISAHPALLYPLVESVDDESAVIVGSGHRDHVITDVLSANVAAVAIADPGYHWAETLPGGVRPPLRGFPNAPMRAVHLWIAPERSTTSVPAPATSLTVAVEDWQHAVSPSSTNGTRCGVAIVGDTDGPLARLLRHAGCEEVSPNGAEIVAVIAPPIDTLDVTDAVDELAGRVGAGLPDYAAIIGPRCRTVWLLTTDGERVEPRDTVSPAHAALAAMHRSVGFEFADQTFGSLDIRSDDVDEQIAAAIVDVLLGEPGVIALRADGIDAAPRRYVRTWRAAVDAADSPASLSLDNVVITGGSGAIGLRYAQYCIEHGARRITLLSRNGVDAETLKKLAGPRHVEVLAPQCDITDRAALTAVAADYAGDGASLLIHAAGIATARVHAELTGADVAAVCAAKVAGLAAMADVWPLQPECRILACSSVFGVWGGHSHAAYAASNRLLDVLAAQLRSRGVDCTAIRWGLWQDAGVVGASEIARAERSGLRAMRPESAVAASLGRYGDDPLIFEADFDRLRVFFESQGIGLSFGGPAATDNRPRHNYFDGRPLADVVCTELAATLQLDGSVSMDPTASLIDLGLDSLLALDLRKRLRRAVGHSAPVAQMLGGITVTELIDVLGAGSTNGLDLGKVGVHA
ncbi:MAG: SDR family NAD(P)-dependent oxidoreductase, partial [Mycobacterium sp.]